MVFQNVSILHQLIIEICYVSYVLGIYLS